MPRTPAQREVVCCHCGGAFAASAMARTLTCPLCHQRISLDDIVVQSDYSARSMATCGRILVGKRAKLSVREARASAGIEVLGAMRAERATTAGYLFLGPQAMWDGDCEAASFVVHPGARVGSGKFCIGTASGGTN